MWGAGVEEPNELYRGGLIMTRLRPWRASTIALVLHTMVNRKLPKGWGEMM